MYLPRKSPDDSAGLVSDSNPAIGVKEPRLSAGPAVELAMNGGYVPLPVHRVRIVHPCRLHFFERFAKPCGELTVSGIAEHVSEYNLPGRVSCVICRIIAERLLFPTAVIHQKKAATV